MKYLVNNDRDHMFAGDVERRNPFDTAALLVTIKSTKWRLLGFQADNNANRSKELFVCCMQVPVCMSLPDVTASFASCHETVLTDPLGSVYSNRMLPAGHLFVGPFVEITFFLE